MENEKQCERVPGDHQRKDGEDKNTDTTDTNKKTPVLFEPTDSEGTGIKLYKLGERVLMKSSLKEWNGMRAAEGRFDDVLVLGYAKSGMHWVYEIVRMLRQGTAESIPEIMELHHIDFMPPEKVSTIPSQRTLCSHRYPEELPQQMVARNCKIIQVIRNPKDVCVSLYYHLLELKSLDYHGNFRGFISLFKKGNVPFNSWEDYFIKWKKVRKENPNYSIHQFRYEDLLADAVQEIKKISKFLEVSCTDQLCEDIASQTKFEKMKKQKESLNNPFVPFYKSGKEMMYRQGKSGDWRNHFTTEEADDFDKYYKAKLEESDYIYLTC